MPGFKITDEDRKKINENFLCSCCDLLLLKPMQMPCGHLMCQSCIRILLGHSDPRCPEDGEKLCKEEIFPDNFKRKELEQIHLNCANPGCLWHSTYSKLEDHLKVCEHSTSDRNLDEGGSELGLETEHLNIRCDGPVTCSRCQETVLKKDLNGHHCVLPPNVGESQDVGRNQDENPFITFGKWMLALVLSLLTNGFRRPDIAEVMQNIRDEITFVCSGLAEKFAMLVGKLTGLERRLETLESSGGGDARLRNELSEMKVKLRDLTAECSSLRERNMSLERELRHKTSIIDRLQSRMDQIDESLALNTVKITDLESQRGTRAQQAIHSYNGTLLWKIEGYHRKRQDAINRLKTALYSTPFYSAQYGYKMCAKIYMNGDGFGKGSHLSLFFVVMRGDYDALQTWPFQKKITMMLLDQGNGDHMIDAFHSDPQSSSFQRPKSDINIASGSPLFMPLDSLNNHQYIKDDVMFIKVIVD